MTATPTILVILSSLLMGTATGLFYAYSGPAWAALSSRYLTQLTPYLEALRFEKEKWEGYLRWWGIAMVLAVLFFIFIVPVPVLGFMGVYGIYLLPRYLLRQQIRKRRILLRDQLVTACTALANASRAGLALAQGMAQVSEETPEPLGYELRRIVQEYHSGRTMDEALADAKARLELDSFTLFTSAIRVCLETGGRVTDALDRIARSLQENQRLDRKLEADTASGRKVVIILGLFPFGFLALFFLMDPEGTGYLFSTVLGQVLLGTAGALVYFGVRWASRILGVNRIPG